MSIIAKPNKHAATEDELGALHAMIATIFKRKLGKWIELMDDGGDPDLIVDMKQLNNVIKFVGDNGIVCADPAASSSSELSQEIAAIKKAQQEKLNVVPFRDEERYG
ncbi:MAG: hypothetical protein [Caudoviricetes sp.]|nr:MAG: hypothetical protein [Caudoviricetes sp.]